MLGLQFYETLCTWFFHMTKKHNCPKASPGLPRETERFQHFFIAQKSVSVLTTSHKKDMFTVTGCLSRRRIKAPTAFKQKTLPKNMNFLAEVLVRCQGKGWMDQERVQDWLRTVWGYFGGLTIRSLCWCGILFKPTCHHQSVTHWSHWIQSPLLQVCCIPWMLQSTSLLKIVWGRSGRSGCWMAKTTSLPYFWRWNWIRSAGGSQSLGGHPKRAYQEIVLQVLYCIMNTLNSTENNENLM